MSSCLIAAIDQFEAALSRGGRGLELAEARLLKAMGELGPIEKYERG